jgi:hypothetical protein
VREVTQRHNYQEDYHHWHANGEVNETENIAYNIGKVHMCKSFFSPNRALLKSQCEVKEPTTIKTWGSCDAKRDVGTHVVSVGGWANYLAVLSEFISRNSAPSIIVNVLYDERTIRYRWIGMSKEPLIPAMKEYMENQLIWRRLISCEK